MGEPDTLDHESIVQRVTQPFSHELGELMDQLEISKAVLPGQSMDGISICSARCAIPGG